MNTEFKIIDAAPDQDPVLHNLLEHYFHDLAEWFLFDSAPSGKYVASTSDYWGEGHKVYLLYKADIPVGFALVAPADEWLPGQNANDMKEFFIVRRYRKSGLGRDFARDVWDRHPGPWLVRVYQPNEPALPFWRRAVADYSNADYSEEFRSIQDGAWSFFQFEAKP